MDNCYVNNLYCNLYHELLKINLWEDGTTLHLPIIFVRDYGELCFKFMFCFVKWQIINAVSYINDERMNVYQYMYMQISNSMWKNHKFFSNLKEWVLDDLEC